MDEAGIIPWEESRSIYFCEVQRELCFSTLVKWKRERVAVVIRTSNGKSQGKMCLLSEGLLHSLEKGPQRLVLSTTNTHDRNNIMYSESLIHSFDRYKKHQRDTRQRLGLIPSCSHWIFPKNQTSPSISTKMFVLLTVKKRKQTWR